MSDFPNSDCPRTDAMERHFGMTWFDEHGSWKEAAGKWREFARTLERELAAAWGSWQQCQDENSRLASEGAQCGSIADDLLEALKECETILARLDTLRHIEPQFPALDRARAAIAKAEGK